MYAKLIIASVAFVMGWQVNGWRLDSAYQKERANAILQAKIAQDRLQKQSEEAERAKNEQIRVVNNRLANALGELRERSSRVSNAPENCQGTSGRELSREDAEFLVREAARADQLRAALNACYLHTE
jgi:phage-related minor tail protein